MAVPAGYEAYQSLRRKGLTLICLCLASAVAMGTSVYVDSYSIHEWESYMAIGPVAMVVRGPNVQSRVGDIKEIDGIEKGAVITLGGGSFTKDDSIYHSQQTAYIDSDYTEQFPNVYSIQSGRYPNSTEEIALDMDKATEMNVSIGETINYSYYVQGDENSHSFNLTVVGLFENHPSQMEYSYWDCFASAIVTPEVLGPEDYDYNTEELVHVDIDRGPVTPFDMWSSSSYINRIVEDLRGLDPSYEKGRHSSYSIGNLIGYAVSDYASWRTATRIGQLMRSSGIVLLVILLMLLAIRYNVNEREYETSMLQARGASKQDTDRILIREVAILSGSGTVLGLGLGIFLSRIALSATSYFQFAPQLFISEPFLVTIESLILAAIVGFVLPLLTLGGYFIIYAMKEPVEEGEGKLAKIAKGLKLIRWDTVVLALSVLVTLALYSMGTQVHTNPYLSFIMSIIPLGIFSAIASLTIKALRKGSSRISDLFERVIGKLSASVGVRRVGRSASSAAPTILVLVLAISLAWNMAVIDASLPVTKMNHARFAFGGDVTFHLDEQYPQEWDAFFSNVSSHPMTEEMALLSVLDVSLSTMYGGELSLAAFNPSEYSKVGYDYAGTLLNESTVLSQAIEELDSTPNGVIITKEVAQEYDLIVGDSVRTSIESNEGSQVVVFSVLAIVEGLSNAGILTTQSEFYWPQSFGTDVMYANKEYLASEINFTSAAQNSLCVNVKEEGNSTAMVEHLMNISGNAVRESPAQYGWNNVYDGWACVEYEVSQYVNQAEYAMDRAVDTMITVGMVLVMFGSFSIYAAEDVRSRKREVALLRAMGAQTQDIVKTQVAELLILSVSALMLLLLFSPVFIANSLLTISTSSYIFPVAIFPFVPWLTLFTILVFFVCCMITMVLIVAVTNSRVNLHQALNAHWAEAGPYSGGI
ncbi:MAG: ABC transporter permease [Candidatus Thorarchaeota archaeon]